MLNKALSISMQAIALRLSESLRGRKATSGQMKMLQHHPHFLTLLNLSTASSCCFLFLVLDHAVCFVEGADGISQGCNRS